MSSKLNTFRRLLPQNNALQLRFLTPLNSSTHRPQLPKHRPSQNLNTSWMKSRGIHSKNSNRKDNRDSQSQGVFHNQPRSWLFVSDAVAGAYGSQINLQLDLPQQYHRARESAQARDIGLDIEQLIADYNELQKLSSQRNEIESRRNSLQQELRELKSRETELRVTNLVREFRSTKKELTDLLHELWPLEEKVMLAALQLPNDLHESTPCDKEEIVLKETQRRKDFKHRRSHVEIAKNFHLIKFSPAGPKAYYLRGPLAEQERQLSDSWTNSIESQGCRLMAGPEFFKSPVMEGCGHDVRNTTEVLTLEHVSPIVEPMSHLAGISPMTFVAYLAKCCVGDNSLPLRLVACGRAYSNSDRPGLFGAVQSTQVGVFSCCSQSNLDAEFDAMCNLIWTHLLPFGKFGLRKCQVGSSKLQRSERRRVEFQILSPHLDEYIPVGHVSDLGDFASRRLMISHNRNHGDFRQASLAHMVSGTAVNITSLLALWMEHSDSAQDEFSLCSLEKS